MANAPLVGLEDVVITDSTICYIDGDRGILQYRGYDVAELAKESTYEETAYLLLYGRLPIASELKSFDDELRRQRDIPGHAQELLCRIPTATNSMAWLRTAVSLLASYDSEAEDNKDAANLHKTIRMTAQLATFVAAIDRMRKNKPVLAPDASLSHAGNFLYMLTGQEPDELATRAMDIALILQADHELNASTFAGRVTVSTQSDIYSAVTSAIGTLKGPLHGGANQRVMEMLESIGEPQRVEPWLREQLAEKKKIMGFGHRVYSTVDPRAAILKRMAAELSKKVGPAKWFEMQEKLQQIMLKEKNLNPNLDFYSATVFNYLGIDTDLFPLIFAMSRVIGWCTHFMEQYRNNRLIRPLTHYTGPRDLHYVPIAARKAD